VNKWLVNILEIKDILYLYIKDSIDFRDFQPRSKCDKEFIEMIPNPPSVSEEEKGNSISSSDVHTPSSVSHEDSFFLKNEHGYHYFDPRLLDTSCLAKHLILHPVDPFRLLDYFGRNIFFYHKYDEGFIKTCVDMWPIPILKIKDTYGKDFLYYHSYSKDFVDFCKDITVTGGYTEEYIKRFLRRFPPFPSITPGFEEEEENSIFPLDVHKDTFFTKIGYWCRYFGPVLFGIVFGILIGILL
jgi:hypothetical protein